MIYSFKSNKETLVLRRQAYLNKQWPTYNQAMRDVYILSKAKAMHMSTVRDKETVTVHLLKNILTK